MVPAETPLIRISTPVWNLATSGNSAKPKRQRQDVGKLPAVARGREQERQRRQQQDRGGEQFREIGGEAVADRGRRQG